MRAWSLAPRLALVLLASAAGPIAAGGAESPAPGFSLELAPLDPLPSARWSASVPSAPGIASVRFEVDGRSAEVDRNPPFKARLRLAPPLTQPSWIEAVALDAAGREIARDGRCVHLPDDKSLLRFVPVEGSAFVVLVEPPSGRRVVEVEGLAPDGSVFATAAAPPYRFTPPFAGPWAARARFDNGAQSQAWNTGTGGGEVVDVRLGQARWLAPADAPAPRLEDVHVLHRGREQRIVRLVGGETSSVELGLAIDVSESTGPRFRELRAAARDLATSLLGPADRSFLVTFSQTAELVASARGDLAWVLSAIPYQVRTDKTRLYEGIAFALMQFHAEEPRAALVVLTDSCDTSGVPDDDRALEIARLRAIPVYALLLETDCFRLDSFQDQWGYIRESVQTDLRRTRANRKRLARMAEASGGSVVPLRPDQSVAEALRRIRAELDRQWTVVFEPSSAQVASGAVEVRVDATRHTE